MSSGPFSPCIKYVKYSDGVQYRLRESPYCTPSACTAHTLYRVILSHNTKENLQISKGYVWKIFDLNDVKFGIVIKNNIFHNTSKGPIGMIPIPIHTRGVFHLQACKLLKTRKKSLWIRPVDSMLII